MLIKTAAIITHYTQEKINDCLLTSHSSSKLFAPLVLAAQQECDEILQHDELSSLEKILQCARIVEYWRAGNCLMKCYLAFDYFLKCFLLTGLSNENYCVPISILTHGNHAFLMINNAIICDPLFGTITEPSEQLLRSSKEYFGIRSDWQCFTKNKYKDNKSTRYTFELINQLDKSSKENSSSEFFTYYSSELNNFSASANFNP